MQHESDEKFKLVIKQLAVDTQIYDMDGTMLYANDAWEKLWQTKHENAIGKYNILKDPQIEKNGMLPYVKKAFNG